MQANESERGRDIGRKEK